MNTKSLPPYVLEPILKYIAIWREASGVDPQEGVYEAINELRKCVHELSPNAQNPVDFVRWVPIAMVSPNDYNPNSVAVKEMGLLYTSISEDGYTQPVVTIWSEEEQKYIIVDGFHRYFTMKSNPDLLAKNGGRLCIVVLNKQMNDRMAATVRHNRARGKHSIAGMSKMVFSMLENGWSDEDICNKIGLEAEELLRLKHVTGFSKLFQDAEYSKAWKHRNQVRLESEWKKAHPEDK